MNREEQIQVKALELAMLMLGPLPEEERERFREQPLDAPALLGPYVMLASILAEHLDVILEDYKTPTNSPIHS
jgi:hypothetical protein